MTQTPPGQTFELETLLSSTKGILVETSIEDVSKPAAQSSRFKGWRFGLVCGAILAFLVFVVNISILIWTCVHRGAEDSVVTIVTGSCEKMQSMITWTHLVINILSTLLLGASNACMQCLVAPTRDEVDREHARGMWLDIGTMSLRNLRKIKPWRAVLWVILALSSIPLHLLYNSVIFSTTSAITYDAFFVLPDFINGPPLNITNINNLSGNPDILQTINNNYTQAQINSLQTGIGLEHLTAVQCIEAFDKPRVSDYLVVLAVTNYTGPTNMTSLTALYPEDDTTRLSENNFWGCSSQFGLNPPCTVKQMVKNVETWGVINGNCSDWDAHGTCQEYVENRLYIDHCLARPATPHCKLQMGLIMLVVVIVCNAIKVVCLLVTILAPNFQPLMTTGDAISSFLEKPEEITTNYRPVSVMDLRKQKKLLPQRPLSQTYQRIARDLQQKHRWFNAASQSRWMIAGILFVASWLTAIILMHIGITSIETSSESISEALSMGLGAVDIKSVIDLTTNVSISSIVLLVNTPQIIVSFLYVMYNGLFTCMLAAREISTFATKQKTLRVSEPVGQQRSTYWLSLPYRYAIPLMVMMGALHWFISQSIFLVRIDWYNFENEPTPKDLNLDINTCGWSLAGLIAAVVTGAVMIIGIFTFGFRKYNAGIPVLGNCSIAISAACHPLSSDINVATLPIMYGVLEESETGAGNGSKPERVGFGTRTKPLVITEEFKDDDYL